jgi:hypothetical protein
LLQVTRGSSSDLDWTLIRPSRIANEAFQEWLSVDEKKLGNIKDSIEDLTDFILQQIASREWIRKAPLISSGKKLG